MHNWRRTMSSLGTTNVTSLSAFDGLVPTLLFPNLKTLNWFGNIFTTETIPRRVLKMTTLSSLTLFANDFTPHVVFPSHFTSLDLDVTCPPFASRLAVLRGLQRLRTNFHFFDDFFDYSPLTSLTMLQQKSRHQFRFPTSLEEIGVELTSDFDFSSLTNLTTLRVTSEGSFELTSPTQLKNHWTVAKAICVANIAAVAL